MWFKKSVSAQPVSSEPIVKIGSRIFGQSSLKGKSMLSKDYWYSKVMDWSMKSVDFKTRMFRFVDVFPYLNSGEDILKHLKEYFEDENGKLPAMFSVGTGVGQLAPNLVAKTVQKNIKDMARLFITGESPEDALKKLVESRNQGWSFTADLLGEATLSEKEGKDYQDRYLDMIIRLHEESKAWESNTLIDSNHLGEIPKVNVSVKISSLYSQIKVQNWEDSKNVLIEKLKPIFRKAKELGVFINLDMEHYEYKDLTLDVFESITMDAEFKDYPHWGIVIQAYLKDSYADCERMISFAKKRGVPFTIRLVKGAYWDFEMIHAKQNAWPIPVFTKKSNSDHNYEKCAQTLLKNYKYLWTALGSHNVRSLAASMVYAEQNKIPKEAFEIQMLYGMADPFKSNLVEMGYRVREYATIGDLVPGMAYLVRRLLENSSNESFLQSAKNSQDASLLQSPKYYEEKPYSVEGFYNHPLVDFTKKNERESFKKAISDWENFFKEEKNVPFIVNGNKESSTSNLKRKNPNSSTQVLYTVTNTSPEKVETAIAVANAYQKTWSATDFKMRAQIIDKVADLIDENRYKLATLQTIEIGKPWKESDGDITEAIDFCRYYAKDLKRMSEPFKVGSAPGEESFYHYKSRGLCAVIAPWNFPLAILCGMAVAPLATGNCVLIKPAEQSSYTAYEFFKILMKAGVPKEAAHFLPGLGEDVGATLVKDKRVSVINFTGSKEVGLSIIKESANVQAGQNFVKKPIVEMGGKNALIIDSDADLDQAVSGLIYSAFGFSGQKCSACSRVIVLEGIYEAFTNRLKEAVKDIQVYPATNPKAYLGPVVDEDSHRRIQTLIEKNKEKYDYACADETKNLPEGNYILPHIFFDVEANSDLAQNEIFGPVLAVIKTDSIESAIEINNSTIYALTGGIYSRTPSHIEKVKDELEVGNLYINRSITGAMVDRHPFGGYKMSGLGSKTGGPDYLQNFMEPRVMTENLVRQGFSPDLLESSELNEG